MSYFLHSNCFRFYHFLMYRKCFPGEFIRMGALTVTHLGTVIRSPYMHNRNYLFPDQYRSFRIYWSTRHIGEVRRKVSWIMCRELSTVWRFALKVLEMENRICVVLSSKYVMSSILKFHSLEMIFMVKGFCFRLIDRSIQNAS